MNNTVGHPKQFIEEMKKLLLEEQSQLKHKLGVLAQQHHGDYQATVPDYGRNEEENVTEVADYTAFSATTEAAEERLKSVEEALRRIEDGTYGVTKDGELITENRLRANPAATTIITPDEK